MTDESETKALNFPARLRDLIPRTYSWRSSAIAEVEMAADKSQIVEGAPHKRYRLGNESSVIESYATAKQAMRAYPKLREVVLLAKPDGRLIIRDGNSEINYHRLKQEAAKE